MAQILVIGITYYPGLYNYIVGDGQAQGKGHGGDKAISFRPRLLRKIYNI